MANNFCSTKYMTAINTDWLDLDYKSTANPLNVTNNEAKIEN